jgi:hypothetical protein
VIGAPYTDDGHNYDIISGMDHLGSDSIGRLMMMVHGNIYGTGIILQVTRDITNPAENGLISWVDHIDV